MLFYLTLVAKEKTGYVKKMNEEDDYTCDPNDDDSAYDAWADNRVEEFYFRLEERISIMKELVKLWNDKSTHTNNVDKRDELEKQLVQNLTGDKKHWQSINSIHDKWGSN